MKALVVSDIHGDFHRDVSLFINRLEGKADVLIVAGDMTEMDSPSYESMVSLASNMFSYVLHVPGNHEYYGKSIEWCKDLGSSMEAIYPNYYFMDRRVVEINGIRIAGATTWFPWHENITKNWIWFNDFQQIKEFKKYSGGDMRTPCIENDISVRWWKDVEAEIWVSHHAPSYLSISPHYAGDDFNCFYVSPQMEDLIRERQPYFHIHGHMHNSFDYMIDHTNVICNPYGYETDRGRDLNPRFRYDLIIDTDTWNLL